MEIITLSNTNIKESQPRSLRGCGKFQSTECYWRNILILYS